MPQYKDSQTCMIQFNNKMGKKICMFTLDMRIKQEVIRIPVFADDSFIELQNRLLKKHSTKNKEQMTNKLINELTKQLNKNTISQQVADKIRFFIYPQIQTKTTIDTLKSDPLNEPQRLQRSKEKKDYSPSNNISSANKSNNNKDTNMTICHILQQSESKSPILKKTYKYLEQSDSKNNQSDNIYYKPTEKEPFNFQQLCSIRQKKRYPYHQSSQQIYQQLHRQFQSSSHQLLQQKSHRSQFQNSSSQYDKESRKQKLYTKLQPHELKKQQISSNSKQIFQNQYRQPLYKLENRLQKYNQKYIKKQYDTRNIQNELRKIQIKPVTKNHYRQTEQKYSYREKNKQTEEIWNRKKEPFQRRNDIFYKQPYNEGTILRLQPNHFQDSFSLRNNYSIRKYSYLKKQ